MELPDHIDTSIKKERARRLLAVSLELEERYANKFVGRSLEVLFEEEKDGFSIGHTSNYLKVKVEGKITPNTFCKVKIESYQLGYCMGLLEDSLCHM